jgi:hypothetical protein
MLPLPPERPPLRLIHRGPPLLSLDGSSARLALSSPVDSKPIALEPQTEKRFQKELPSLGLSSSYPADRWTLSYSYQVAPAASPLKPVKPVPVDHNRPGADQPFSKHRKRWVDPEVILEEYQRRRDCKLSRASQPFKKASGFIRKLFLTGKKRFFRQDLSGAQKKIVKLLKRQLGAFYRRPIGRRDGPLGSSKSPTATYCTDSHRQQFSFEAALDPAQIADNHPREECLSSDDKTGWIGREVTLKIYHQRQRDCILRLASHPSRKSGDFISESYNYPKTPISQSIHSSKVVNPVPVTHNPLLSPDDRTEWVEPEVIFRTIRIAYDDLPQVNRHLTKPDGFIGKSYRPDKTRSFRRDFSVGQKRRPCLGHSAGSSLRIRGWSPSADDRTGGVGREFIPKTHYQQGRDCKLRRARQPLRKTDDSNGQAYRCYQKPFSQGFILPESERAVYEEIDAAVYRLVHYMMETCCSYYAAMEATRFSLPGDENLYWWTRSPTNLSADSPLINRSTP